MLSFINEIMDLLPGVTPIQKWQALKDLLSERDNLISERNSLKAERDELANELGLKYNAGPAGDYYKNMQDQIHKDASKNFGGI